MPRPFVTPRIYNVPFLQKKEVSLHPLTLLWSALLFLTISACGNSDSRKGTIPIKDNSNTTRTLTEDSKGRVTKGKETKQYSLDTLRRQLEKIGSLRKSLVGISIIGPGVHDTISIWGDRRFPMQSVFKFHISLAVLAEVDRGRFSLLQQVNIPKEELLPEDFWSPLRDEHPNGGDFTIKKLIEYAVASSDNTACDALIKLMGGPKSIENHFKKNGFDQISIVYNEEEMQSRWENMFENWTTPKSASEVLLRYYENKDSLLSKESHAFIWSTMKSTTTGDKRIKGLLPSGTVVAHKTGWSSTNKKTGITAAVNNIGIVFLPDGDYFIISVFVTESKENFEENERTIAELARAAFDFFK
jgi:beta-lactamase class A